MRLSFVVVAVLAAMKQNALLSFLCNGKAIYAVEQ